MQNHERQANHQNVLFSIFIFFSNERTEPICTNACYSHWVVSRISSPYSVTWNEYFSRTSTSESTSLTECKMHEKTNSLKELNLHTNRSSTRKKRIEMEEVKEKQSKKKTRSSFRVHAVAWLWYSVQLHKLSAPLRLARIQQEFRIGKMPSPSTVQTVSPMIHSIVNASMFHAPRESDKAIGFSLFRSHFKMHLCVYTAKIDIISMENGKHYMTNTPRSIDCMRFGLVSY